MLKPSNDKPKVDLLTNKIPVVVVSKQAIKKMKVYIDECSEEVGWLGTAHKHGNAYIIDDVMLFDQEVHLTTTEITPEGLSSFGEKILSEEGGIELWNNIKVWGHSHVNMSTFSSEQDDSQMKVFSDCGHDFFIRIIGNKKDEMRVDLYEYTTGVIYNYIPWIIEKTQEELEIESHIQALQEEIDALEMMLNASNSIEEDFKEVIKKEINEKVKSKTTIPYYNSKHYNSMNNHWGQSITQPKKNQEEEKEEVIDNWILEELSGVYNVKEATEILELYGYGDSYSTREVLKLMQIARNMVYSDKYVQV